MPIPEAVYHLVSIDEAPFGSEATITFPEEGEIEGEAPCNRWSATQSVPYPWFEAGPIAATKRACPALEERGRLLFRTRRDDAGRSSGTGADPFERRRSRDGIRGTVENKKGLCPSRLWRSPRSILDRRRVILFVLSALSDKKVDEAASCRWDRSITEGGGEAGFQKVARGAQAFGDVALCTLACHRGCQRQEFGFPLAGPRCRDRAAAFG